MSYFMKKKKGIKLIASTLFIHPKTAFTGGMVG